MLKRIAIVEESLCKALSRCVRWRALGDSKAVSKVVLEESFAVRIVCRPEAHLAL